MPSQGANNGPSQAAGNNQFVKFSRGAAQRIAKAVRVVEAGDRAQSGVVFDHPIVSPSQKVFRIATANGAWPIGTDQVVTFKYVATTPNTALATNLFWPLDLRVGDYDCAIAKEGTAWFLIAPTFYVAHAATAATVGTAALEFKTLPVVAIATSSTVQFYVDLFKPEVVTNVTLTSTALRFDRCKVFVLGTDTASTVQISIVTCSTATT